MKMRLPRSYFGQLTRGRKERESRRMIQSWMRGKDSSIGERTAALTQLLQQQSLQPRHTRRLRSSPSSLRSFSGMKDEYGKMDSDGHTYVHPTPFQLESGQVLEQAQLRYQVYGEMNEQRDNVVVVCHALTGNASLHAWWGDLLGSEKVFDTDRYCIVCCNTLGSCYGSTSPVSEIPQTTTSTTTTSTTTEAKQLDQPLIYGNDFPAVTVQDTVRLQLEMLVNELKVNSIKCVVGGSFGGMQTLEYAVQAGSSNFGSYFSSSSSSQVSPLVRSIIPIACGAQHTAWQIGLSELQRQVIRADPEWPSIDATQGLSLARQMAMVSYRTPKGYRQKFGRALQSSESSSPAYGGPLPWKVKSYLHYQGVKFVDRFDPITYVKLTEQMDSHDIARNRTDMIGQEKDTETTGNDAEFGGAATRKVLEQIDIPALVMGIDSDVTYPLEEQEFLARHMPGGNLKIIHSDAGHDGFLLEQDQVAQLIAEFLAQND